MDDFDIDIVVKQLNKQQQQSQAKVLQWKSEQPTKQPTKHNYVQTYDNVLELPKPGSTLGDTNFPTIYDHTGQPITYHAGQSFHRAS